MWLEIVLAVFSSSAVAALVTSICNETIASRRRKEEKVDKEDTGSTLYSKTEHQYIASEEE